MPCLRGVTLASDRGYWEKTILFGQMLEAGADVIGTVKRVSFFCRVFLLSLFFLTIADCCHTPQNRWFPLTFDHPNYPPLPQAPQNIPFEGYRDAFLFHTKWKGKNCHKNLTGLAYRSGTGKSVALSISTTNHDVHWDFVPHKDKDLKWYLDTNLD